MNYSAFADLSGGRVDSATLAIAHLDGEKGVLDLLVERAAPFSPEQAVEGFCALLKQYGCHEVTGDKYAASWVSDAFEKNGISYEASERSRSQIYLEFLPSVTSQRVELLDHARMVSQFLGLERKVGRNADIVDHGPGGHDDLCNAAAGALVLALGGQMRHGLLEYWHDQYKEAEALKSSPVSVEEAAVRGASTQRELATKADSRFGAPRQKVISTTAVQARSLVFTPICPQCKSPNLTRACVAGISGDVSETCACGWANLVPRPVNLRRTPAR